MARSRNIKPGFFRNEDLVELSFQTRLLFIGLWTVADREGRLEDRPKRIRAELFPYDMELNIDQMLNELANAGFLIRYEVDGNKCIQVVNFIKHQNPHYKEVASEIPAPPGHVDSGVITFGVTNDQRERILNRDDHKCQKCGAIERLQIDHIIPRSKGGLTTWENVVAACAPCNLRKANRLPSEIKMFPHQAPYHPTVHDLHNNGRAFPPNHLHQSWLDYLYWDIELEP